MLTEELILSKHPKCTDIYTIKKLNIWGEDIEDISIISKMKKLTILSLSSNNISDLSPLESCINLRELYLRNNNISSFQEITHLKNLLKLKILWLEGNPISDDPFYRYKVLQILPQVSIFDNKNCESKLVKLDVTLRKRNQSENQNRKANYSQINDTDETNKNCNNQNKKILLKRVCSYMGSPSVGAFEASNEENSIAKKKNIPLNKNENAFDLKLVMNMKYNNKIQGNQSIKKLKLKILDDKDASKNNQNYNNNNNIFNYFDKIPSKRRMSIENNEGPIQLKTDFGSNAPIQYSKNKAKKHCSSNEVLPISKLLNNKNEIKNEKKKYYDNGLSDEKSIQKINNHISDNNHVLQAIYLLVDKMNVNELLSLKEEINKKIKELVNKKGIK